MPSNITVPADARAYVEHLRAVPFVEGAVTTGSPRGGETVLSLSAHGRKHTYAVRTLRTHLSLPEVARWIGLAQSQPKSRPLMLFAPYVSGPMGARLREAGVQYVDQAGNMHLALSGGRSARTNLVALVEGKRPPRTQPSDMAWRAPSYQVLLALLAHPELVSAPLRTLAREAGVSTSPALQVQKKLLASGWVVEERGARRFTPRGRESALGLWLAGYHTTLRPQLLVGRYRPRGVLAPEELERHIEEAARSVVPFRWGGAAAAHRLDGYYRGDRAVLHVEGDDHSVASLASLLRLMPDADGPVVVLRLPGHAALDDAHKDVVHPLLAWAELLEDGNDRAGEAAQRLERAWKE